MNKTILGAILVLALIVLVSATTVSVMTVKPATPKSVFVKTYDGANLISSDFKQLQKDIITYSRSGYIVKVCNSQEYSWVLVMEKY